MDREIIQKYIDSIYDDNKIITFTAPTGFGRHTFFMKPILETLTSSQRNCSCLMLSSMTILLKQLQEDTFNLIEDKSILENRTKNSLLFKNGSSISYYSTSINTEEINPPDILYIDSPNRLVGSKFYDMISLIKSSNKTLIVANSAGDMSLIKYIRYNLLCYSFDFKKIDDLLIELRWLKIQKIKDNII